MAIFLLSLLVTVASVHAARHMALSRGRSRWPWMWAAAFLGPFALPVLAVLPRKGV